MRLHGLLSLLRNTEEYQRLRTQLADPQSSHEIGLLDPAIPYVLASLQHDLGATICLVVADPEQAGALRDELTRWVSPDVEVRALPEPDFPYADIDGPSSPAMTARAQLASYLSLRGPDRSGLVLVSSVLAMIGAMRPPEDIARTTVELRQGSTIRPAALLMRLERMGYERIEIVTRSGEMSNRGGIVDVFSPAHDEPFRVEFFGDEVDSIRFFDPYTQRTTSAAEPVLAAANSAAGESASILDYLPSGTIVTLHDPQSLSLRSLRLHAELAESSGAASSSVEPDHAMGSYLSWSDI